MKWMNEWTRKNVLPSIHLPVWMLDQGFLWQIAWQLLYLFMAFSWSEPTPGSPCGLLSVVLVTTVPGVLWVTRAGKHSFSIKDWLWSRRLRQWLIRGLTLKRVSMTNTVGMAHPILGLSGSIAPGTDIWCHFSRWAIDSGVSRKVYSCLN